MKIKTFHAKTMAEALQEIKVSLGPDALLLSTKEIARRSGVWSKSSGFEVVAAIDDSDDVDVFSIGVSEGSESDGLYECHRNPAGSFGEERVQVYSPATLVRMGAGSRTETRTATRDEASFRPQLADEISPEDTINPFRGVILHNLYRELVQSGVEDHLARTLLLIAQGALSAGQRNNRAALIRSLSRAVMDRISLPSGNDGVPEKRVVVFVGPTGAGKTTSLAKLAARLGLQKKRKIVLMTLDGQRVGAIDQLRSYAGLMGIPFRFVEDVSQLPQSIRENNQRDYILIDTAGRSPRDLASMQPLAEYLQKAEQVERHLVLSASTKPSDLRKIMDQFEIFNPDHLVFTKLDETWSAGPILNELVRTRKCFSYYTDGLRVPDDLHAAPGEHFMEMLLQRNDIAFKE